MKQTASCVPAYLASGVQSARRTSTSVRATPVGTEPTARTVLTATPAPARPDSAGSTVKTTLLTAQRGTKLTQSVLEIRSGFPTLRFSRAVGKRVVGSTGSF